MKQQKLKAVEVQEQAANNETTETSTMSNVQVIKNSNDEIDFWGNSHLGDDIDEWFDEHKGLSAELDRRESVIMELHPEFSIKECKMVALCSVFGNIQPVAWKL